MTAPLHTFTSHIAGKNAKVEIYSDRIEWNRPRGVSGGKLAAGAMTGGLSLLATGFKNGKAGTEMIPVKSISSVATKRDGLLNTLVQVITSGNTIDFRVSHAEAETVRRVLNDLILGGPVAAPAPLAPAAPAPAAAPDVAGPLQQLEALRGQGLLSDEEYATKRAEVLARL